jgi:predicted O-methyltransferase YrrM
VGAATLAGLVVAAFGLLVVHIHSYALALGFATAVLLAVAVQMMNAVARDARNAADTALVTSLLGQHAPALGLWAAEGDFAQLIAREIQNGRNSIVECGSGITTLLVAAQLRLNGSGRLYTIEHDPSWIAVLDRRLANAGLRDWVEIIPAALVDQQFDTDRSESMTMSWYDTRALCAVLPEDIDLLIVDGPPVTVPRARWPALNVLHDRLAADCVVLLDDGRRRYERQTAYRWQAEHDEMQLFWHDTVKGTWRLVRAGNSNRDGRLVRALRACIRHVYPRPQGFGRWPVSR